jgi:hypothetical protein
MRRVPGPTRRVGEVIVRRWILSMTFAGLGVVAMACSPSYPECRIDENCGNNHCVHGRCQQCGHANHCSTGQRCVQGRCE